MELGAVGANLFRARPRKIGFSESLDYQPLARHRGRTLLFIEDAASNQQVSEFGDFARNRHACLARSFWIAGSNSGM
jgi:hypothetical protein